jgi:hypothetical protein
MGRRERGAVVDAVRAGRAADPAFADVAVRVADRELDRLARVAGPVRLTVWRVLHGLAAAVFLAWATVYAAGGHRLSAAVFAALGLVFAASALRARRRLARRIELVARARTLNAGQGTAREA